MRSALLDAYVEELKRSKQLPGEAAMELSVGGAALTNFDAWLESRAWSHVRRAQQALKLAKRYEGAVDGWPGQRTADAIVGLCSDAPSPLTIASPAPEVTAYAIAERFIGIKEVAGTVNNPQVMAMLRLDATWPQNDEVAWCSAFVNYCAWLLRLPRSKNLAARSWLTVGRPISLEQAVPGFDVVIQTRSGATRDPSVLQAPGHVGWFGGLEASWVHILGGNQHNGVNVSPYKRAENIGVRRLVG